jgi:plastocyanin
MRRRRLGPLVLLLAVLAAATLAAAPTASAGGGGCHRPPTEGRGSTLTLTDACFSPTVLRVTLGAEVTILNRDPVVHPLGRPGGEWFWDGAGQTRTVVRMRAAGTYPFFCYAHPGMVGVVVVGDGQGPGGAATADVAMPAQPAAAVDRPAAATAGGSAEATVPTTWLVLVALAALAGAVAGTRLAVRGRRG